LGYEAACERIKSKPGNMTVGGGGTALGGCSFPVIAGRVASLRDERFPRQPARRPASPRPMANRGPSASRPRWTRSFKRYCV